jgi:hypothetical protein
LVREILVSLELLGFREHAGLLELIDQAILLYQDSKNLCDVKTIAARYIAAEKLRWVQTLNLGFAHVERLLVKRGVHWVSGQDILSFEKEYGLPLPLLKRFFSKNDIAYHPKAIDAATELWKLNVLEMSAQSEVSLRGVP